MFSSTSQLIEDAVSRHRAEFVVGDFSSRIGIWRGRLADALEKRSCRDDPNEVRTHLRQLYNVVRKAYADFRFAILKAPPHSQIDYVERAFHQLLASIRSALQSQLPVH
jgi:hypothetical protein